MSVPAPRAGPIDAIGPSYTPFPRSGKGQPAAQGRGARQTAGLRPGNLCVLGKGSREVTGHEVGARPDLSYVRAVAEPGGAGELLEGVVVPAVARCASGRSQMILSPRLDGRDQRQIRPTATAD